MSKLHEVLIGARKIARDRKGQAGGGFMDHPIVYVIILFGLAAVIGSVMMMLVGETDKVITIANDSKWNESYYNVVGGVALGFSMYKLVALMGIMSIVLPMLFLMFSRRGMSGT